MTMKAWNKVRLNRRKKTFTFKSNQIIKSDIFCNKGLCYLYNSKNIICGCIYRHPRHNLSEFLQYLEKCLKIIAKENKEVYICGDFNIDLLKIESINSNQEYYNLLCSYGLLPQIIQPTRVVENQSPSLIDNIFTNNISEEITGGNIYLTLSEHFFRFVSVKREKIDYKSKSVFTRDYANFSSESFQDDISIQNWNNRYDNINDQFNDFHWRLDECVNRHAPFKKLSPGEIKLKCKSWISSKITKMIKVRNKLFARKKRQPKNAGVCELFKKFRNRINREILKSKKDYFAKYFSDYSNNIKKTWQGIREIINIKNPTAPKIAQLTVNGRIFDNPKDIAEKVNDYFVNIGPNTEKEIPKVQNISPTKFLKERNQFNFLIAHISNEEVLDIVNSLSNKATGPYIVPLKLLILISDLIIIPLCYIINMSLFSGIYPDKLKIVKVIPIHKGGSTQDLNNFSPISLLSIFDKIIEKIIHARL